jgi:hypothetical protein
MMVARDLINLVMIILTTVMTDDPETLMNVNVNVPMNEIAIAKMTVNVTMIAIVIVIAITNDVVFVIVTKTMTVTEVQNKKEITQVKDPRIGPDQRILQRLRIFSQS